MTVHVRPAPSTARACIRAASHTDAYPYFPSTGRQHPPREPARPTPARNRRFLAYEQARAQDLDDPSTRISQDEPNPEKEQNKKQEGTTSTSVLRADLFRSDANQVGEYSTPGTASLRKTPVSM